MRPTLHRRGSTYSWTLKLGAMPPAGHYTLVLEARPRSSSLRASAWTRLPLKIRR
jgi:hypothetical protein